MDSNTINPLDKQNYTAPVEDKNLLKPIFPTKTPWGKVVNRTPWIKSNPLNKKGAETPLTY